MLRVAHDKALRKSEADASTQSFEDQLLAQVEQLAAQIMKSKDDAKEDKSGAAHPSMFRGTMRASHVSQLFLNPGSDMASATLTGVNF